MAGATFSRKSFSSIQKQQLNHAINTILTILENTTQPLSPKDRSRYGKVGEKKKQLIELVRDYHAEHPEISSPDVDWEGFEMDYQTRQYAEQKLAQFKQMHEMLLNIKIIADYQNYNDVLADYGFATYKIKHNVESEPLEQKIETLKVLFPKTGKGKK